MGSFEDKLIAAVRSYEVIFNKQCSDYRDQTVRIQVWNEIATILEKPVNECKRAWNKLRNCHCNALKRRKKGSHFPPWRYEKEMAFLLPHMVSRPTENIEMSYETDQCEILEVLSETSSIHNEEEASPKKMKLKISSIESQFVDEVSDSLNVNAQTDPIKLTEIVTETDENVLFFLSMAKIMRKLPQIQQANIRFDLHKEVYEAELRHLQKY